MVVLAFVSEGASNSLLPTMAPKVFGNRSGGGLSALILWFSAFSVAAGSICLWLFSGSYKMVFNVAGALTIATMVNLYFFSEKPMKMKKKFRAVG